MPKFNDTHKPQETWGFNQPTRSRKAKSERGMDDSEDIVWSIEHPQDGGFESAYVALVERLTSHKPTAQEIEWRLHGYLDCLNGLAQDGLPDPRYVEFLCEKTGRALPPPLTKAEFLEENLRLKRIIKELTDG